MFSSSHKQQVCQRTEDNIPSMSETGARESRRGQNNVHMGIFLGRMLFESYSISAYDVGGVVNCQLGIWLYVV